MPTYEYKCKNCKHTMEEFQSMKDDSLVMCPVCHTPNLVRVIGNGSGLIFRGKGFYLTDYKKGTSPATTSSASSSKSNGTKTDSSSTSSSSSSSDSAAASSSSESSKSAPKADTSSKSE
jgi:putative FmdB family regulatory protein